MLTMSVNQIQAGCIWRTVAGMSAGIYLHEDAEGSWLKKKKKIILREELPELLKKRGSSDDSMGCVIGICVLVQRMGEDLSR